MEVTQTGWFITFEWLIVDDLGEVPYFKKPP